MDTQVLVIPDALPERFSNSLAAMLRVYLSEPTVFFDEYTHQWEPKLQLKKEYHEKFAVRDILEYLGTNIFLQYMQDVFGLPYKPELDTPDNYFTAVHVGRPGDYLQRHYDCAIHNDTRKAITVCYYLSHCVGGELRVADDHTVTPEPNMLVAFANTDWAWHEVTKIEAGKRFMLTTGLVIPAGSYAACGMFRTNTRAIFAPGPDDEWAETDYAMASKRAQ